MLGPPPVPVPVFSEDTVPADAARSPGTASVSALSELRASEPPPDFQAIFATEFDYVWHTLRRLGVRDADLEDVTHDVFLTLFRKLDQYDPARPLRPWIFGFAFRVASDYRDLARHRREVPELAVERRDEGPNALDRTLQAEALALARDVLATLELDRRAVFILHELDECPMPEVAEALGISINTAYGRLRLARAELASAARRLRLRLRT